MNNAYIIFLMGGGGSRFGAMLPKQFTDIEGIPLYIRILRRLSQLECISGIVVVVNKLYLEKTKDEECNLLNVAPRSQLAVGASPEGFKFGQIHQIYKNTPQEELEKMTSVGAIALANKIPMKLVPTKILNLKITHPDDMEVFMLLRESYFHI